MVISVLDHSQPAAHNAQLTDSDTVGVGDNDAPRISVTPITIIHPQTQVVKPYGE